MQTKKKKHLKLTHTYMNEFKQREISLEMRKKRSLRLLKNVH